MIVSKPISFFKQENSGNGYATDDENNESNKDTSTDKRKTEKHWKLNLLHTMYV